MPRIRCARGSTSTSVIPIERTASIYAERGQAARKLWPFAYCLGLASHLLQSAPSDNLGIQRPTLTSQYASKSDLWVTLVQDPGSLHRQQDKKLLDGDCRRLANPQAKAFRARNHLP